MDDFRQRFVAGLGFAPDPFQRRAFDAIDDGHSVLVAAPTGAGKTLVADYVVDHTLHRHQRRVFYTAPIKALSNQKYRDLVDRHGPERVGLLTGDTVRNPDASVVVMTTEVLRNMIYERSSALDTLGWVVIDEVHFLQDPYRGPVWEEVIIGLDRRVGVVALSATVSNVDEVVAWLTSVRGPTEVVVSHDRPVPLELHLAAHDRQRDEIHRVPLLEGRRTHPDAVALTRGRGGGRGRLVPPHRADLADELARAALLPAIWFIFSRAACDDAAAALAATGRRTTADQRSRIHDIAATELADLDDDTHTALDTDAFLARLDAGVAAHHAGLVPAFKVVVERCFVEGLLSVVFATETLALGINMPARTVVLERLQKFDGQRRALLTPSQFTQLTGRAGRRGLDTVGHGVVCWSPWVGLDQLTRLATSRQFVLTSAFRPTYNMSVNLVRRHDPTGAAEVLNRSFAQFQADAGVVQTHQQLADLRADHDTAVRQAHCERGDVTAWAADHRPRAVRDSDDAAVRHALAGLRPGDVITLGAKQTVVIAVSQRKNGSVRVTCVDRNGRRIQLHDDEVDVAPEPHGHISLPQPYRPTAKTFQREVSKALRRHDRDLASDVTADDDLDEARDDDGGVGDCPDLDTHLAALATATRLARRIERLEAAAHHDTGALSRRFRARLDILEQWGHLDGWALTPAGERLARIYHEADLLVATAIDVGLLDGLSPVELAAMVSVFTFETRGPDDPPPPWYPSVDVRDRVDQLAHLAHQLNLAEAAMGVEETRGIDAGLLGAVHGWAAGVGLVDVLDDADVTAGDFVRSVRSVIDLLGQIAQVGSPDLAATARAAIDALDRGVVEAAGRG